jgi:superfamily II DNA helicase RecQ
MGFAETVLCRRVPLLNYFGETDVPDRCGMCDNCRPGKEKKELVDLTIPAQMFLSCVKRTGEIFGAGHIVDVLRGEETFFGRVEEAKKDRGAVLRQKESEVETFDSGLFETLRKKRKALADQENLPPYAIFHDRTLREMACYYPRTRDSSSVIYRIGTRKLEKYADAFLDIIREHCQTHQIPEP